MSSGLFAAFEIMSALLECERTGQGSYIDLSMTDGVFTWTQMYSRMCLPGSLLETPTGSTHISRLLPHYGLFEASDGGYIALGIVDEDEFWKTLCSSLGLVEYTELGFAARIRMRDEIEDTLQRVFRQKTRADWLALFAHTSVPITPVNSTEQAIQDPQLAFRRQVAKIPNTPPRLGQDTRQALETLGYREDQIHMLTSAGVIQAS